MPFDDPSIDDPWPDEPDDPDPAERWGDPERDLPTVPKAPTPSAPAGNDVSPDLMRTFWAVVVLTNVGLFAVSLGPMLAYFRGQWALGGLLVAFGVAAFAHAYRVYRRENGGANAGADRDDENGEGDTDGDDRAGTDRD